MWNRNTETVLAAVEKSSFYCCASQRALRGLMLSRLCEPTLDGVVRSFNSVQGGGCDQLMDNSWIGWHQGAVSSIINFLVSTSLESVFLLISSFHLEGSVSQTT